MPKKTADKLEQIGNWKCVDVQLDDGIAWVTLSRPEKRNAMNPDLNDEMVRILDTLEIDHRVKLVVLTGAGDSFSAGMDLREYFRALDHLPYDEQMQRRRSAWNWQWRMLMNYSKPTIAMVNGWCFGGAFTPLVACDLAIASDDAQFGLSEINWGIVPGGNVTRAVVQTMRHRDAMYYIMTGNPFDGKKAAEMGLVNESVPKSKLRERTRALAVDLKGKNPATLRACKQAVRFVQGMSWEQSDEYLMTKNQAARFLDTESGRQQGLKQFLDDKSFKPGLQTMKREEK
jgi:trans-feruloyl-CoA hydratase/vanillin synthase